ncbi:MAG: hypothetical protein JWQ04_1644 [Pedosphaera sp.]|nr:hypothetical protein [Pedosphaera sp.]
MTAKPKISVAIALFPLFTFLIFNFKLEAQLPTNNLAPSVSAVMANTNGVLTAPANFFAANSNALNAVVAGGGGVSASASNTWTAAQGLTNKNNTISGNGGGLTNLNPASLTGVISKTNGGIGFAMTNWVPAGASYNDGTLDGFPTYYLPVISNGLYFAYIPGNSLSNDQGLNYLGDLSASIFQSGYFIPLTNRIQIAANNPGTPILTKIYFIGHTDIATNGFDTNALYADLRGRFTGLVDPTSSVPDSALSANIQLKSQPLNETANSGNEHKLYSTNTINGSTLSLIRYGTNGYADVNFFTAPNLSQAQGNPTLWFAVGMGASGAAFPYKQPYFESYLNVSPIYYVGANQIFGGFFSTPTGNEGDFIWFQDGTTNTPMFRISRSNKVISNYFNASFSSNVAAASFTGNGAGLTNLQLRASAHDLMRTYPLRVPINGWYQSGNSGNAIYSAYGSGQQTPMIYTDGLSTFTEGTIKLVSGTATTGDLIYEIPNGFEPPLPQRSASVFFNGTSAVAFAPVFDSVTDATRPSVVFYYATSTPTVSFFENQGRASASGYLAGGLYNAFTVPISDRVTVLFPSPLPDFNAGAKVCFYFHGTGDDAWSHISDAVDSTAFLFHSCLKAILQDGWTVISSDGGTAQTNHWGNPNSYVATTNALAWVKSIIPVSKIAVVGQSMGGLSSLRALTSIPGISNCYEIYPVCNLNYMFTNSSFTASITTAYTNSTGFSNCLATCDPMQITLANFAGKNVKMTSSYGDTVVDRTNNADKLLARLTGTAASVSITTTTGNHGDPGNFLPSAIVTWLDQ